MDESERLQRWKENYGWEECGIHSTTKDEEVANRIASLLNHPGINKYCMVDAYYYDFSVIPRIIKEKLNLCRDTYLIFGITTEGEMVSKWVDRWSLDSSDPIVDGNVIHNDKPRNNTMIPEIRQCFNPKLLSVAMSNLHSIFPDYRPLIPENDDM
jgi:hypothetical protein